MIQLVFDAERRRRGARRRADEGRLQPARGRRESRLGRSRPARGDRRHASGRPPGRGLAREPLRRGALPRAARPRRASAATTRPARPATSFPPCTRFRAIPAEALDAFPWIEFQGRWGELQPSFYNGPTGPNLKGQWTEPIAWSEEWNDRSYAVPAGGLLGTGATDFFCGAISGGSVLLSRSISNPWPAIIVIAILVGLAFWGISRATWTPTAPLRLARRRYLGSDRHGLRPYVPQPAARCCSASASSSSRSWSSWRCFRASSPGRRASSGSTPAVRAADSSSSSSSRSRRR